MPYYSVCSQFTLKVWFVLEVVPTLFYNFRTYSSYSLSYPFLSYEREIVSEQKIHSPSHSPPTKSKEVKFGDRASHSFKSHLPIQSWKVLYPNIFDHHQIKVQERHFAEKSEIHGNLSLDQSIVEMHFFVVFTIFVWLEKEKRTQHFLCILH